MPAKDLSVLIPARCERWLKRTIEDVLSHTELDTEVIAVCDGDWPDPPISDHPKLTVLHVSDPVGQRGGVNLAAKISRADFVMKLDAHCAVDQGFDRKLIEPYRIGELDRDVTTIPRMYALHVFDWVCEGCGARYYQADPVPRCECGSQRFRQEEIWTPRLFRRTDFGRFDSTLHWQYWRRYERHHPEAAQAEIAEVMSSVGACFFMRRDRFEEIEGLDEGHGFWGQFGTEVSCKSWLSGGRQVVNKRTWFAHLFRVGKLKFPYPLSGEAQERARQYSRDLWFGGKWRKAIRSVTWIPEHFAPVPGWEDFRAAA